MVEARYVARSPTSQVSLCKPAEETVEFGAGDPKGSPDLDAGEPGLATSVGLLDTSGSWVPPFGQPSGSSSSLSSLPKMRSAICSAALSSNDGTTCM